MPYLTVAEEEIPRIESVLTIVGGKVVHGAGDFGNLAPPLPISPDWSPVGTYGGYHRAAAASSVIMKACHCEHLERPLRVVAQKDSRLWGVGCDCFAL